MTGADDAVARLLAAARRARDVAGAVAGGLRRYAWVLAAAGVIAWFAWVDPWRLGSAARVLFVLATLGALLVPALLVARFAVGLAGLAGLPERIEATEAARAVSGAATTTRAAFAARGAGRVRAAVRAANDLRKAIDAARTTAAAIAAPAAAVGLGGIAGAVAGLVLGVPLILLAVAGLLVAL